MYRPRAFEFQSPWYRPFPIPLPIWILAWSLFSVFASPYFPFGGSCVFLSFLFVFVEPTQKRGEGTDGKLELSIDYYEAPLILYLSGLCGRGVANGERRGVREVKAEWFGDGKAEFQ